MATPAEVIDQSFAAFRSDPDYVSGMEKLDQRALKEHLGAFDQHYASHLNHYFYLQTMKQLKARNGSLKPAAEKRLVERGREGVTAIHETVKSMKAAQDLLDQAGVTKALDRHGAALSRFLDQNPRTEKVRDYFDRLGVPKSAVDCVSSSLAKENHDLLRFKGGDGTVGGVVRRTESLIPVFETTVDTIEAHGVPVIAGGGGGSNGEEGSAIAAGVWIGFLLLVIFLAA